MKLILILSAYELRKSHCFFLVAYGVEKNKLKNCIDKIQFPFLLFSSCVNWDNYLVYIYLNFFI